MAFSICTEQGGGSACQSVGFKKNFVLSQHKKAMNECSLNEVETTIDFNINIIVSFIFMLVLDSRCIHFFLLFF